MHILGIIKTNAQTKTTTITTNVAGAGEEDGPFFDLDFPTVAADHDDDEERREEAPPLSLCSAEDDDEVSQCSDPMFYNTSSINVADRRSDFKHKGLAFPIKSAAKLHGFSLGLHRKPIPSISDAAATKTSTERRQSKFLVSLFTRQSSARSSMSSDNDSLSTMKTFDVRGHKKYGEETKFSGKLSSGEVDKGKKGRQKILNFPSGLKFMYRRFVKSRSSSISSFRSSPMHEDDGIEEAIAHCKLSFNTGSKSPLTRSRSDPGHRLWKEHRCIVCS